MTQQELPAGAGARQGALAVIYAFRSPGSGAVYIGKHNCDPTGWPRRGGGKLPDGYSGSGKIVSRFHRRHGSFVEWRLLSVIGGTPDQVNEAERRAIRLTRRIFSRLCVNVLDGGEGHTSASAIAANADPILRARRIDALKAHAKTTIGKEQSARRFAASKSPAALANLSPLGLRAVATVAIKDFPSNDVGFDPYLADRAYDPMTRGSFWSKWLARNPYHVGFVLRIYDGYFGDALTDMIKREYSIEKIDATRASVRITAKDILRKVTDNDLKAPALSPGALSLALTNVATTFQVAGAALADYPATGWLRVGSEVMEYTGRALAGRNVEFTGLTRGALGTTASTHSQFAQVQRVLAYIDTPFSDIIYDLLTVWGEIPTSFIDKPAWDAEFGEWRELYRFTGYVTAPESIQKLVGELCQQGLANAWWDERVQRIIFRAQRPNFAPNTITQEGHIVADSLVVTEHPKDRASRVYVYYSPRNPVLSLTDKSSFANAEVFIDVGKERQYGEKKIKEIFCRWVQTGVIARALGGAYLLRFRDVRKQITFNLTAKDIATLWTGDVVQVRHFMLNDFTGRELVLPWLITSAETVEQGGVYRFVAEDNESGGLLWEWVADDETRPAVEIGAWVDVDGTDGAGTELPFAWI